MKTRAFRSALTLYLVLILIVRWRKRNAVHDGASDPRRRHMVQLRAPHWKKRQLVDVGRALCTAGSACDSAHRK